jgi:Family of unknown function (DUF5759)
MALTAKDVAAMEKARANVKKETYRAMLEQFSRKIRTSYELGRKEAVLTIPPFVIGYPKYDLAKAVVYMARQLIRLGYVVELVGPVDLNVKWEKPIELDTGEQDSGPIDILPGLVNLQKTAQRLRVTKHK